MTAPLEDTVRLSMPWPRQLRDDVKAAAAANGDQSVSSWIRMVLQNACALTKAIDDQPPPGEKR